MLQMAKARKFDQHFRECILDFLVDGAKYDVAVGTLFRLHSNFILVCLPLRWICVVDLARLVQLAFDQRRAHSYLPRTEAGGHRTHNCVRSESNDHRLSTCYPNHIHWVAADSTQRWN